jgi:hypothetical protein
MSSFLSPSRGIHAFLHEASSSIAFMSKRVGAFGRGNVIVGERVWAALEHQISSSGHVDPVASWSLGRSHNNAIALSAP